MNTSSNVSRELLFLANGTMKKLGDTVVNKKYAETLRKVAKDYDAINNGSLSAIFLEEVNSAGGNMSADDLKSYEVLVKDTIKNSLGDGLTLHTTPLPGGGSVLTHILNMFQGKL